MRLLLLNPYLFAIGLSILLLCQLSGIDAWLTRSPHHPNQSTMSQMRCRRNRCLQRSMMIPRNDDDEIDFPSLATSPPIISTDCTSRRTWMRQTTQQIASAALGITVASHQPSIAITSTATTELLPTGSAVLCDSTVSVWQKAPGRTVYLLGTAHISDVSAQLAGALVRYVHPDAVFVELDVKRVQNLPVMQREDSMTANTQNAPPAVLVPALPSADTTSASVAAPLESSSQSSIASTSSAATSSEGGNWFQRKVLNFAGAAVGKVVQGMYSNLSNSGFSPGEEFAAAIRVGREMDATIVLGDQDVQVTLRRLAQALSVTDLEPLLNPNAEFEKTMTDLLPLPPALESSKAAASDPAQFKRDLSEYVERMKSRDTVRTIVHELDTVAPAVVRVMLTERDAYMASGLDSLESFGKVVAVMGLAHIDGVERNLQQRGWMPVRLACPAK